MAKMERRQGISSLVVIMAAVMLVGFAAGAKAADGGSDLGNRVSDAGNSFISPDTVVVGCTAGAAAGALTVLLPALALAFAEPAVGFVVAREAVTTISGIGCAVGVVSGLAAIGTAIGLTSLHAALDGRDHNPVGDPR
jgi:hypothetical protein